MRGCPASALERKGRDESAKCMAYSEFRALSQGDVSVVDREVVIVGAGFSGIGLGIQLRKAGFTDFAILEAADDLGGVWHHNRYPGVAVDIPSTTYSYSYEPNPSWSRLFAPGDELAAYAKRCAAKYGVVNHIRLNTRVEAATYDERHHQWNVRTGRGPLTARFLVSAVGPLDQPKYPDIPGLDTFAGRTVHTARWDPDLASCVASGSPSSEAAPPRCSWFPRSRPR